MVASTAAGADAFADGYVLHSSYTAVRTIAIMREAVLAGYEARPVPEEKL